MTLLKACFGVLKRYLELVADALNGTHDADSNKSRDQRIFNRRSSALTSCKSNQRLHRQDLHAQSQPYQIAMNISYETSH